MWPTTNPTPISPVTAMTIFLPIVEPQKLRRAFTRDGVSRLLLQLHRLHRLANGLPALCQSRPLLGSELDFDDLFQPPPPQLSRDAEGKAAHAILPLQPRRARQHA